MTDDIKLHPVPRVLLRDLSEIRAWERKKAKEQS